MREPAVGFLADYLCFRSQVSKSGDARTGRVSTYVQEGNRTCVSFFFPSRSKKRFSRRSTARGSPRDFPRTRNVASKRSARRGTSALEKRLAVSLDGSSRGRLRGGSIPELLKACASMYRDCLGCVQRLLPLGPTPGLTGSPHPVVGDDRSRGLRDRALTDTSLFQMRPSFRS